MRLLLDTHAFLWFANNDPCLSDAARLQTGDPDNERLLSTASLWEVAIKISIGKLKLPASFDQFFKPSFHKTQPPS